MKHTTKLLTLAATLVAVIGLTGCPGPVNNYEDTHEHIWELVEEVKPTCTTKGTKTYKCKLCEETKVEEVSALGHTWVEEENHSCHYKCHCGATKEQHTFECGGCDKCGAFEFNGENDYQLEIEIYKTNVSKTVKTCKDWFDNKTKVDTVYFSFNKSTLSNYKGITIKEVNDGEIDENTNELILTQEITVNLNVLILCKTSYNIIEICNGDVQDNKNLHKGHNLFQVLVE